MRPLIGAVIFLLIPASLHASSFYVGDRVLGQVRQNQNSQREIPVNDYLSFGGDHSKWRFSGESDMRFFRDFARKINSYDLYQTVIHVNPVDALKIDFGRQFISEGFVAIMQDAIKFRIMPPGYVDIVAYSGIPRSVEVNEFNRNNGLRSGLALELKNVKRTSAALRAVWQRNNIRQTDWTQNDTILAGADLSHQFAVKTMPMLYGLFEYNATAKVADTATVGIDIYPSKFLSVNAEFDYFNINHDTNLPTILGTYARGGTYSGRFNTTWTILPDYLYFVQNYAYQRMKVPDNMGRNGHILDVAFQVSFDKIGLEFEPGYYFSKSWGGKVNGARILVHEQFTDAWYADLSFDFSKYTKVTNNNDNAYSTVLWSGYEVLKGLIVSGGFEYNRNAFFNNDIRGSFNVSYEFDHNS